MPYKSGANIQLRKNFPTATTVGLRLEGWVGKTLRVMLLHRRRGLASQY